MRIRVIQAVALSEGPIFQPGDYDVPEAVAVRLLGSHAETVVEAEAEEATLPPPKGKAAKAAAVETATLK